MLIVLIVILSAILIMAYIRHTSKSKAFNHSNTNLISKSQYKWSVVIKSKGKLYKGIEDDDLGKVGYYIYQNFATKLDQVDVYVKDNLNNEILKIQKTYESECMIGVDHPEKGHIGYLPFEKVDRI